MSSALENLKTQLRALGGFHERQYHHSHDIKFLSGAEPPLVAVSASIPIGAITQVTGSGKTECLIEFLATQPKLRLAWVESEISIYPCALSQRKLALETLLFTEAGSDYIWATLQILASSLFDIVVLSLPFQYPKALSDLKVLRRLQLTSEKSKSSLILILDNALEGWPISLHLEAQKNKFHIIRSRA